MIDTHCHIIPKFEYDNSKEIIQNALQVGVSKMICIGCDFEDIDQTINLADKYKDVVYAAIGLHPETVKEDADIDMHWNKFCEFFQKYEEKIFAIGECGLDYHYSEDEIIHKKQRELFKRHIKLSIEKDKPLIIHTRDAWDDTFNILDEMNVKELKTNHHIIADNINNSLPDKGDQGGLFPNMDIDLTSGIIHSFTGGIDEAKKSIERNFKLGINGIVTFKSKNLDSLREAVKFVGVKNIVLETDSPFLSPEPYRGKTNEPARIKEIAEFVKGLII